MISNRISENLCYKSHFDKAAPDYNIALKNSGSNNNVTYNSSQSKRQTRKRQILWFNALYSGNVKTKAGKIFIKLFAKHFLCHHKYHWLLNRNNIKLRYSCMTSMNNIIQKHSNIQTFYIHIEYIAS